MKYLFTVFIALTSFLSFGQSSGDMSRVIDSLETIVKTAKNDTIVLNAIREWDGLIYITNPQKDLELLIKACDICENAMRKPMSAEEEQYFRREYGHFLNDLSYTYRLFNDYDNGLPTVHRALNHYKKWGDSLQIAGAYNNVGIYYGLIDDIETSMKYFLLASDFASDSTSREWADAQNNLAEGFFKEEKYSKALVYFKKAYIAYDGFGDEHDENLANTCSSIGNAYNKLGKVSLGLDYIQKSIKINMANGDLYGLSNAYQTLAKFYFDNGNAASAIKNAKIGLDYADSSRTIIQLRDANKLLHEVYKWAELHEEAMFHYEAFIALQDSILASDSKYVAYKKDLVFEYQEKNLLDSLEFAKDMEVERIVYQEQQEKQKIQLLALLFIAALIIVIALIIYKSKQKSEKLLLNILPKEIALELKKNGNAEATLIKNTTVLFTDFKGFTALSEILSPKKLVEEINLCFSAFDHIMGKHNIEKIKTIGDAYMAAGGLPTENTTHANDVLKAALEIKEFMLDLAEKKKAKGEPFFEIRIGVHTGPVVAGIVGVKKFQYDIWGDTVNTAARMESSGGVGKVNISETTYEIIKDNQEYTIESRGKVEAKGKGMLEMFFVKRKSKEN
ncbi:MAG: adenylate cyclase [Parvicellaceae bacterium]|jgi:adenylate cyclase